MRTGCPNSKIRQRRDKIMRTTYHQPHKTESAKIVYLDEYRQRERRDTFSTKQIRGHRAAFPVCRSDLLNLGMVVMTVVATGMILTGL